MAAVSLAMAAGVSAAAASAATTPAAHISAVAASAPATPKGHITSTVTGTFRNAAGRGTFKGTFTPKKFKVVHGKLEATGILKGKLTSANGKTIGTVTRTVTTVVETHKGKAATAACNILNLTLGPLNLNLLGLVVHLNTVHLTITAVPGPGNLLGNLLCAIAGLLNGSGSLSQISALLNQVLALLGL
ncbi:MAG: hypothetical protein JOY82_06350 [Streptosporangiaceae bacterium]|nr:hypothetical protein [Streptosporangiaceae bacterium]MBV9854131.1 hypothetical protein [Streptosporangiaceae bacterium]